MSKPPPVTTNHRDNCPRMKMKDGIPTCFAAGNGQLEGSGKSLHFVRPETAGENPPEVMLLKIKSEPEEGQLQLWETQWRDFLKEAESSCSVWGNAPPSQVRSSVVLSKVPLRSGGTKTERLPPAVAEWRQMTPKVGVQPGKEDPPGNNGAIHSEIQRQRFRGYCYQEAEGPRSAFLHLQELCRAWLKPERNTKNQIVEGVVLEQFLAVLPTEMQNWVRGHGADTCSQAVALAEEFLARPKETEKWEGQILHTSAREVTVVAEADMMSLEAKERQPYRPIKEESTGDAMCLDGDRLLHEFDKESQGVSFEKLEYILEDEAAGNPEGPEKHLENELQKWKQRPRWELGSSKFCRVTVPAALPKGVLKHTCPVCGKAFTRKSSLNRHLLLHAGEKPYKCSHCGKGFNRKTYLLAHEVSHREEKSYPCSDCGKNFKLRWGVTDCQVDPSGAKVYKCSTCKKSFHGEEESYQCSDCKKSFKLKWGVTTYQVDPSGAKVYKCSSCRKSFRRKASLVMGRLTNGQGMEAWQMPSEKFKEEETSSSQEKPEKEVTKERREIKYTSILGPRSDQCKVKTPPELYKIKRRCPCPVCGKTFATQSSVNRHQRIHTGEKPYECADCGKSFNQKTTLLKHAVVHTGQKPYHCSECGKSFRHSSALLVHRRMHTGERPYKCLVCQRNFTQSAHVIKHIVRKHTREKPPGYVAQSIES